MITNATLIRVDTLTDPTTGGDLQWSTGSAISYRCCVQALSRAVKRVSEADLSDADTELYIEPGTFPAAPAMLINQSRVAIQPDRVAGVLPAVRTFLIVDSKLLIGGLSNLRCICKSE